MNTIRDRFIGVFYPKHNFSSITWKLFAFENWCKGKEYLFYDQKKSLKNMLFSMFLRVLKKKAPFYGDFKGLFAYFCSY